MYEIYDIKPGDTLESIAYMYDITVDELKNINGEINNTTPGVSIIVPKKKNQYFDTYTIKKGDTLYKIAESYNINPNLLALINGLNTSDYIYPNDQLLVPKKSTSVYITAEGDTLDKVVRGMNANVGVFLKQNDRLYLKPGQLIVYKEGK